MGGSSPKTRTPPHGSPARRAVSTTCSRSARTGWAASPTRSSAASCRDRKSTRLNSSHSQISYAVFCLKKKKSPRAVVTVYDLLLLSKATDFPWYKRVYHHWAYGKLVKSELPIVSISAFCRRAIVQRL